MRIWQKSGKIGNRRKIIDGLRDNIKNCANGSELLLSIQVAIGNISVNLGGGSILRNKLEVLKRMAKNRELIVAGNINTQPLKKELDESNRQIKMLQKKTKDMQAQFEGERQKHDDFFKGFDPIGQSQKIATKYFCDKHPKWFCCPLSGRLMEDPVTVSSGMTYDRKNLVKYYQNKKNNMNEYNCPETGEKLIKDPGKINTNILLLNAIKEYKDTRKKFMLPFQNNITGSNVNNNSSMFSSPVKCTENQEKVLKLPAATSLNYGSYGNPSFISKHRSMLYFLMKENDEDSHVFFILEYIDDSNYRRFKKIHLVLDNKESHHENIFNITGTAKIINEDITANKLREIMIMGCKGECFPIGTQVRNRLINEIIPAESAKPIAYNRNGNSIIYIMQHESGKVYHNCFSWGKYILKEINELPEDWKKIRASSDVIVDNPTGYLTRSIRFIINNLDNKSLSMEAGIK